MPLYIPPGSPIPESTFAALPPAGANGSQIYVSDIGEYGAVYTAKNGLWTHSGKIEIFQRAKGWIEPSLAAANAATYSQTGTTITVTSTGHNIPATNYDTKDVYLNIGTAATGATIPPGWFSNFQRTSADTFTCVSTVSQIGTGTVNTNLAETAVPDLASIIPAAAMGLSGQLIATYLTSNRTPTTTAVIRIKPSTVTLQYTTSPSVFPDVIISNRNNYNSQVLLYNGSINLLTIDTSVDFPIGFYLQCTEANDYAAIHSASLYINPS